MPTLLRSERRHADGVGMDYGFDIRFHVDEQGRISGDPVTTDVEYVGNCTTSLDMCEAARALLHRATNFVNTDDGYQYEQDACDLAYTITTGAADMLAHSPEPAGDDFRETYCGFLTAHVMKLLRENPCPPWPGPSSLTSE